MDDYELCCIFLNIRDKYPYMIENMRVHEFIEYIDEPEILNSGNKDFYKDFYEEINNIYSMLKNYITLEDLIKLLSRCP
jgi:hypothetical protein